MFKKLGLKSSKKAKGESRRTSTDSASGGAAVPYSPTSPTGGDVTSLLSAAPVNPAVRRDSDLTGSPNGQAPVGPQIPIANAGGTPEEGRLLGEAAGKNDLEGVRSLIKLSNIPVNTLDEVRLISVKTSI